MSDDDLLPTLTDLGRQPTPPPDPAFADRLDAHLRALHVEQMREPARRPVWVPALAGLAGVAAVVIAAVLSLSFLGGEPAEVVMTAAADTEIVLPGEGISQGTAGQRLPDGTQIVVGPDGEAVVGGVVLGPGAEAIVVGDRLEVLGGGSDGNEAVLPTVAATDPAPTTVAPTSTAGPDRPAPSNPPSTADRPGSTDRGQPTSTSAVDRPVTSPTSGGGDPPTSQPPGPTTTAPSPTTVPATTGSTPSTAPTTSHPPPAPSIDLTAESTAPDRVVLDWVLANAGHPARWRIEAVAGDRTSTLAVLRDGTARTATVARVDAQGVGFRVVALRADGSEVLASDVIPQPAP